LAPLLALLLAPLLAPLLALLLALLLVLLSAPPFMYLYLNYLEVLCQVQGLAYSLLVQLSRNQSSIQYQQHSNWGMPLPRYHYHH
jgi:hypothetical protein